MASIKTAHVRTESCRIHKGGAYKTRLLPGQQLGGCLRAGRAAWRRVTHVGSGVVAAAGEEQLRLAPAILRGGNKARISASGD